MVSSTTMPSTAEAIMAVPVLRSMPVAPMRPAVHTSGTTYAMTAMTISENERKTSPVVSITNRRAELNPVTCERTRRFESLTM